MNPLILIPFIWWTSSDPSVLGIHPETGAITHWHRGTVEICVEAIPTSFKHCFTATIE